MESISNRAVEATVNFLTHRGYKILDRNWQVPDGRAIDVVARDKDGIAFVAVTATIGPKGFRKPEVSRAIRESAAAQWLASNDEDLTGVAVRFDDIALMVLDGSKAILRHHINALGSLGD